MGGAVGASSGVFDQYLRLSAQQNGGAPAPDDLMRVRKWTENGISTRALTTLRDAVQNGADLREIKAKTERLGGIVDNMMADPKNEKARPALELIKEMTLDPQTQGTAIREAFGVIQQQQAAQQAAAEQAQLTGLMGQIEQPAQMLAQANNPEFGPPISLAQPGARAQYVANAVPQLTPEQRLQVGSNPGLRSMFNQEADRVAGMGQQIMQPTMGERWQSAMQAGELEAIVRDRSRPEQERFAAATMLNDMGYKTASNMPGQQREGDGGMKQVESQLGAIRSAARSLLDQLEREGAIVNKQAVPAVLARPEVDAKYRQLQQLYVQEQELAQRLAGTVMPASGQAGPMTLTELDAMRGGAAQPSGPSPADALRDSITADLTAQLGRPPTAEESLAEFRRRKALRQGQR